MVLSVVWYGSPPTNSLVCVVSFCLFVGTLVLKVGSTRAVVMVLSCSGDITAGMGEETSVGCGAVFAVLG